MKIVPIFANSLFSFHYENELNNEYNRLIELWTNVGYLYEFAKEHNKNDIQDYVQKRLEDAEQIIDIVDDISNNEEINLEMFFRPLSDNEFIIKPLSLQKGKTKHRYRRNDLRIYAIKIDENCFVITGGAIKLSQAMQESPNTNEELQKLKRCKEYLIEEGVLDKESFFELIL